MKEGGRSQLNIKIDPQLLLELKAKAIRSGKTLTAYVTDLLEQDSTMITSDFDILEQRLLKIEAELNLKGNFPSGKEDDLKQSNIIFSNSGAKRYGEVAKELFDLHRKEKGISMKEAFAELSICLSNYDSQPELVFELLSGNHELTGLEMTDSYRNGSCGMRSALSEWTKSSLEPLNEAFLNAVDATNLV